MEKEFITPQKLEKTTVTDAATGREYYYINFLGKKAIRPYVTQHSWNSEGTKFIFGVEECGGMFEYDTVNETAKFLDYAEVNTCLNAVVTPDDVIYYRGNNNETKAYNWKTGEIKVMSEHSLGVMSITNDGRYISGYDKAPYIKRIDTKTGKVDVHEKDFKPANPASAGVGHPLINPTKPNMQMVCNEGRTQDIPDRLWLLDWETGEMFNAYDQTDGNGNQIVCSGHEIWGLNGENMYWVNYFNIDEEQDEITGIVRRNVESGEIEYLSPNKIRHWHCSPSEDDRFVSADIHVRDGVLGVLIANADTKETYELAQFPVVEWSHPYHPHPCISRKNNSVSWAMCDDNKILCCAWADITDITK